MPNLYGTLNQIRDRLPGMTATTDDELLLDYLEDASRMLDGATGRRFYPRIATRHFDHPEDDETLKVDDDLLEVSTFTTDNGGVTIAPADYYLKCGATYNLTPYDRLVLRRDGTQPNLLYSGTPQKANAVTGTWGYHDDWSSAWRDSGDEVGDASGINASVTSITVGAGSRFGRGQTLKVGDEFMYLANISANSLAVERGLNGSTAAAHDKDTAIYIYVPPREVQRVALRLATWLYKQRESPFSYAISTDADGKLVIPPEAPPEVKRFVKGYAR
jgi:hypothetical protein